MRPSLGFAVVKVSYIGYCFDNLELDVQVVKVVLSATLSRLYTTAVRIRTLSVYQLKLNLVC